MDVSVFVEISLIAEAWNLKYLSTFDCFERRPNNKSTNKCNSFFNVYIFEYVHVFF